MTEEPRHQGGRDRLPAAGLAFLPQHEQALVRVEVGRTGAWPVVDLGVSCELLMTIIREGKQRATASPGLPGTAADDTVFWRGVRLPVPLLALR